MSSKDIRTFVSEEKTMRMFKLFDDSLKQDHYFIEVYGDKNPGRYNKLYTRTDETFTKQIYQLRVVDSKIPFPGPLSNYVYYSFDEDGVRTPVLPFNSQQINSEHKRSFLNYQRSKP